MLSFDVSVDGAVVLAPLNGFTRQKPTRRVAQVMAMVFCALLTLTVAGSARAQSVQGVVTGVVTDASGAIVPGADLTLVNDGTNVAQDQKSQGNGDFRFGLVPPGTYTLTTKASGFTPREIKSIIVDASTTVAVNVTLSVATATTVMEVTSQESMVQTSSSDLSSTVNEKFIDSMPLLTRNVFDLAFAAPSVTQGMNFQAASGGSRESGTTYMLNGADNNDNFSEGSHNITPPLESVAEFTMLTNNMSAEYGHASGALVSAIQKSGTNSFHGVAYEFNRNTDFNASDFFSNRDGSAKPEYIRNQFGGEVDGPIIRNKTFFAFAYDRVDIHQGATQVVQLPTTSELAAITAGAGPNAQYYLKQFSPLTSNTLCPAEVQNAPDAVGHIGCIVHSDPQLTGQNTYTGKIDHNFSEKNRLSFTANFQWYGYNDKYGGGYATGAQNIPYVDDEHYHNLSLVDTHTFNATIVNELTIAHNRHYSKDLEGNGTSSQAEVVIDGANYDGLGFGYGAYEGGLVEGFVQDRWQLQDNLAWTKGKHSFKFGGGFQYGILYRNWDLGSPGEYEFANTTGSTPASLGDIGANGTIYNANGVNYTDSNFQNDFPYYSELSVDPATGGAGVAYRHYIMKDMNFFFNDSWKATKRLTLNLGLRWERYGAPTEANNKIAQFTNLSTDSIQDIANATVNPVTSMWKTPNHDFGPRVGFAYDVFGDGKTSLRGGFGISYDRLFDNIWSNGAWNPPFYALLDHDATAGDSVYYSVPPSIGSTFVAGQPIGRVSVRTMDVNMRDSSVQNYYLGVERQFWHDFLLRVNYQGSLGRHLSQLMNLNRYDGMYYNDTVNADGSVSGLTGDRPNALYTGFNYRANNINSSYNSMTNEVQKRFAHGLQMQFSFTWSKLMDEGSDLFSGSTTSGEYSQPFYFVSNNAPQLERAPGAFDHQKNFKAIFTYEIPFFKNQHGFFGRVLGGWQLSSFYQGYSGHPIEVYNSRIRYAGDAYDSNGILENIGGDYNLDGVGNDRPVFVGSSVNGAYSHNNPADGIFADNNPIGCGYAGAKSSAAAIAACNANFGVSTPSTLFVNPSGTGPRFGTLGRDVFRGPWFNGLDGALIKNFKITEIVKMQLRFEALNLDNHANFDGIDSNLDSNTFGKAQILIGNATSRNLQLGARIIF
jgi:hypothetical protein